MVCSPGVTSVQGESVVKVAGIGPLGDQVHWHHDARQIAYVNF